MALYKVQQGDTRPLRATLKDGRGAFDLTNVDTMTFAIRPVGAALDSPPLVMGAASPIAGKEKQGRFQYPWADGETDDRGMYDAAVRCVMNDGEILTFPGEPSDFRVEITASILPLP